MESTVGTARRRTAAIGLWVARGTWFAAPLLAGSGIEDLLDVEPRSLQTVATAGLWAVWAVTLLASFVPRPLTLTVVRVAMPAGSVVLVWAAVASNGEALAIVSVVAVGAASVAAFLPSTSDVFVDGASYGSERRFALRAPGALLLGPVELAWVAVVVGGSAGPLLLGGQRWVAGVAATVVGLPVAAVSARALHGLSRRWVVFVPAGLVLHDLMALHDPVLFPRRSVRSLEAASAETGARDLTLGAPGLALELRASDAPSSTLGPLARGRGGDVTLEAILVTPSRPGGVLDEAATRRFNVVRG